MKYFTIEELTKSITATKLGIEFDDETATNNELKGLIFAKLEM